MSQMEYATKKDVKRLVEESIMDVFLHNPEFRNKFLEMLEDFLLANAIEEGIQSENVSWEEYKKEMKELLKEGRKGV